MKEVDMKELYAKGLKNALAEIEEHGMDFWREDLKTRKVEITIVMECDAVVYVKYNKETIPFPATAVYGE